MKNSHSFAFAVLIAFAALPLQAATATFTNGAGNGAYTNSLNWSGSSVPDTSAGDTARIASGSAVTYTPGVDLTIGNGGVLQVSNGSFTQVVSGNYIQLTGNGTVLVDGGTFNQGTASSNPFNISGTGNLFKITAGTANISSSLNLNPGMTYLQTGGTVNVAGDEIDFNSTTNTLSGGTLNAGLITGVNAAGNSRFDITGGTLNLTGAAYNGIYAGDINQHLNFVTVPPAKSPSAVEAPRLRTCRIS